jgi:hypothetical protein
MSRTVQIWRFTNEVIEDEEQSTILNISKYFTHTILYFFLILSFYPINFISLKDMNNP